MRDLRDAFKRPTQLRIAVKLPIIITGSALLAAVDLGIITMQMSALGVISGLSSILQSYIDKFLQDVAVA